MLNFFFVCEGNSYYATKGYKVVYGTYLASQQNITNLKYIQFPVFDNIGVLFTLEILPQVCEKHIQTLFSLEQFRFWSITQSEMLCHVSVLSD